MAVEYPAHWEADVVLTDGGTLHLRPIRPDDADALVRFHARLSPETIRFRFFAPHPRLSPAEVERCNKRAKSRAARMLRKCKRRPCAIYAQLA